MGYKHHEAVQLSGADIDFSALFCSAQLPSAVLEPLSRRMPAAGLLTHRWLIYPSHLSETPASLCLSMCWALRRLGAELRAAKENV